MKVLVVANSDVGLYRFRIDLLKELSNRYDLVLSFPFGEYIDKISKIESKKIDTRVDRRGKNPLKDILLVFTYLKIVFEEKPSLIITYTIKPNLYCGIISRFIKTNFIANITGLGSVFQNEGLLRKIVIKLYRFSLKNANVVLFENKSNLDLFVQHKIVDFARCKLMMGAGVNTEYYSYSDVPNYGEHTNFLFVGRLMEEKGIFELIKAYNKLLSDGLSVSLDIIGPLESGVDLDSLKIDTLKSVKYHGTQLDVRPFINKSQCVVLPSWHEGLSNTNLEAAASGRAIVTSNIPGCQEAVVDGETGFVSVVKDSSDLYLKMKKFHELNYDSKRKMGLASRRYITENFKKEIVVERTVEIIDSILL